MVERGLNVETVAAIIGMDRSTLYRKLNNLDQVTVGEAVKLKNALAITDSEAIEIFFN
jgi:predicted DNA-binding transcriptional regulator AlpA